jgi:hypothetical protein
MAKINLGTFADFRDKKIALLEENKISDEDFANSTFGFVVKHHIKPATKANNRNQVILNYLYWLTFIERKIVLEERLIEAGLGSLEQLNQAVKIYIKRRDKMIYRLIFELKEKPKLCYLISPNLVEIVLKDDVHLYASKSIIDEIGESVSETKSPIDPLYAKIFAIPYQD